AAGPPGPAPAGAGVPVGAGVAVAGTAPGAAGNGGVEGRIAELEAALIGLRAEIADGGETPK
ncbi:hypothetical protein Q5424_27375, partial [Conexibacter sp. JD483]|uniref:hypothetical protein n=3 Tax=unclassified Conexibacter TaxID=2627773 RepID=UPI002870108A